MSEVKHTPGPWGIEQYTPNEQAVDENTHYSIIAGSTSVATLIELSEETEANAKLIAACPDMLSALQAAIALADKYLSGARTGEDQAVYDQVKAAIDKATT